MGGSVGVGVGVGAGVAPGSVAVGVGDAVGVGVGDGVGEAVAVGAAVGVGGVVPIGTPATEPLRIGKIADAVTGSGLPTMLPTSGVSSPNWQVMVTCALDPSSYVFGATSGNVGGGSGFGSVHPLARASFVMTSRYFAWTTGSPAPCHAVGFRA